MTAINPAVIKWFEGRGISAETVIRSGVYSARRASNGDDGSVEPDDHGNIIVFPFIDRDGETECAAKYRAAHKHFWQKVGGRKTFFNGLILDDPALADGNAALCIVEGEIDCLSVIEAGYPWVVSVPDGAPPARDKDGALIPVPEGTSDIDPEHDDKFKFISSNWDRLSKVKRIIIAADADEPGKRLAAELVRRLGRVRCWFVAFPDGCKDFNDVLVKHGPTEITRVLNGAKPYPVSGIYKLSEFPPEPPLKPVSTGWGRLDDNLRLYHPAFMVVTGLAGAGKSSWTNQLAANLAYHHAWNIGIASFEMRVRPYVTGTLETTYRELAGRRSDSQKWLEDRFVFIAPDPDDEEVHDIDWLVSKAEAAVIRHGIRALIIDPWNEIEHARVNGESQTDYTGRAIRALKTFGRRFDCLVIVVAHPTKSGAQKSPDEISLYDVSDSAHFSNKADLGVVIARIGDPAFDNLTAVIVKKVRYQPDCGMPGRVEFAFDRQARLFGE